MDLWLFVYYNNLGQAHPHRAARSMPLHAAMQGVTDKSS
jgi:hypothetical protein